MYKRNNLVELLQKASYKNLDLKNHRLLVRCCLNVAMKDSVIVDDTRIIESLPLLTELKEKAKRVVIMAHLGRPAKVDSKFSLEPVRAYLESALKEKVTLVNAISKEMLNSISIDYEKDKRIFLIENIRFFSGEMTKNEDEKNAFAQELSDLGDIFINDAFPDYNASVSTYELAKFLPSYVGPTMSQEVKALAELSDPKKPFVVVLGGAKLSEKLDALYSLLKKADKVLIGGAMAYTLLSAKGISTGKSLVELDKLEVAKNIIKEAVGKLILPVDHVCVKEFKDPASQSETEVINSQSIPDGLIAIDIGPKTTKIFNTEIESAKTILWNGPVGVFEWSNAGQQTKIIANTITTNAGAFKVAGGGDTISAINKYDISGMDYISTGGGAMLAFLAYETFPILDIILDQF